MTSLNFQRCLTPGKQIIKQRLKFLFRKFRQRTPDETAAAWFTYKYYHRALGYNESS
jgi:hypothetical protein